MCRFLNYPILIKLMQQCMDVSQKKESQAKQSTYTLFNADVSIKKAILPKYLCVIYIFILIQIYYHHLNNRLC